MIGGSGKRHGAACDITDAMAHPKIILKQTIGHVAGGHETAPLALKRESKKSALPNGAARGSSANAV